MCTCLRICDKNQYFGRTLDLEFHYNEEVVITPREYEFKRDNGKPFTTKYAMIGMAFVAGDYPLYYEASNEYGLCIAGLNFPYNAKYFDKKDDKLNLTPFEFIPYFLGKYKTINEAKKDLENLNLTNENFKDDMPLSPLHFMMSDNDDCIVLEQTKDGLKIYQNPYNVMTNNPPFNKQIESINKYANLSNKFVQADNPTYGCVGLGAVGLPGDYSSQSRFIKTHFMSKYAKEYDDEISNVTQFFHILDSVSMIKNSVLTKQNKEDITFYSSCINSKKGIYYFKTYNNNQINSVCLNEENINSHKLTTYVLSDIQQIKYLN